MEDTDFLAEKIRRDQQIKTLCDHCGNVSFKNLICKDETEKDGKVFIEHQLYKCTICDDVILQKTTRRLPNDYHGSKQPRFRSAALETIEVKQLWPAFIRCTNRAST